MSSEEIHYYIKTEGERKHERQIEGGFFVARYPAHDTRHVQVNMTLLQA